MRYYRMTLGLSALALLVLLALFGRELRSTVTPNYRWLNDTIPIVSTQLDASTGTPVTFDTADMCWRFPPAVRRSFYTLWAVPHDWDPPTMVVYPHLDWSPIGDATTDASNAAVRLGLSIRAADIDGTYTAATSYEVTATVDDGASDRHYQTDLPAAGINLGNAGLQRILLVEGYRDGSNTDADSNTDQICIHALGITYQTRPSWPGTIRRTVRENWAH